MESPSIGPTKGWVVVASLVVFAQLVLALSMKSSYPLTTFGDTSQCILLLGALLYLSSRLSRLTGEPGDLRLVDESWLRIVVLSAGPVGHTLKFIDANKFRTHF